MLSIKDFARDYGVSYEAVRRQIKRYGAELQGHIHVQGRTQYLDEVAVAFLAEHRAKPAVAVYDGATDRRIQELESENKTLLAEKVLLADRVAALADWKAEKALEIAEMNQTKLMLASAQGELEQLKKAAAEQARDLAVARAEADAEHLEAARLRAELEQRRAHPWKYLFRRK